MRQRTLLGDADWVKLGELRRISVTGISAKGRGKEPFVGEGVGVLEMRSGWVTCDRSEGQHLRHGRCDKGSSSRRQRWTTYRLFCRHGCGCCDCSLCLWHGDR